MKNKDDVASSEEVNKKSKVLVIYICWVGGA